MIYNLHQNLLEAAEAVYQTCNEQWGPTNGVTRDARLLVDYFAAGEVRMLRKVNVSALNASLGKMVSGYNVELTGEHIGPSALKAQLCVRRKNADNAKVPRLWEVLQPS